MPSHSSCSRLRSRPAATGGESRLVGVVVDSDGKPVADVDVWLSSGLPPSGERPLIGGVLWRAERAGAARRAASRPRSHADRPGRALPASSFPPKSSGARSLCRLHSGPTGRAAVSRRGDCRGPFPRRQSRSSSIVSRRSARAGFPRSGTGRSARGGCPCRGHRTRWPGRAAGARRKGRVQ